MKKIGNNDDFWRTEAASKNLLDEAESFESQMDPESEQLSESTARTIVSPGNAPHTRRPTMLSPYPKCEWNKTHPDNKCRRSILCPPANSISRHMKSEMSAIRDDQLSRLPLNRFQTTYRRRHQKNARPVLRSERIWSQC